MSQHWGVTAYFFATVQEDSGFYKQRNFKYNEAKKPHFINDKVEKILSEWHNGFDK